MRRLRIGIVGLGTWAKTGHLPVYRGSVLRPVVQIAAFCSRSMKRAQEWAGEYDGSTAYDSFETMVSKAGLDAVVVCTPDHVHTEYVIGALEAGCHVLVEKPLATSLDDCRSIMEAATVSGKRVLTLYHKRADPLWAEASVRIRSGRYGTLQMGWASIQNPTTVPTGDYFSSDLAAHSDPNWFLGTHFYDLLRFMTALEPIEVRAYKYDGVISQRGVDTLDGVKADVTFAGGASVSFFMSWNLPSHSPSITKQQMRLHFSLGELALNGTERGFVEDGPDGYRQLNPYFMHSTPGGPVGYGASYLEAATLELLGNDRSERVRLATLEDAWWATAVAQAVQESVANGRTVTVVPPPITAAA